MVHSFVIVNRRACPKLPARGPAASLAAEGPGVARPAGVPSAASTVAPGGVVRWHGARVDPAVLLGDPIRVPEVGSDHPG